MTGAKSLSLGLLLLPRESSCMDMSSPSSVSGELTVTSCCPNEIARRIRHGLFIGDPARRSAADDAGV